MSTSTNNTFSNNAAAAADYAANFAAASTAAPADKKAEQAFFDKDFKEGLQGSVKFGLQVGAIVGTYILVTTGARVIASKMLSASAN